MAHGNNNTNVRKVAPNTNKGMVAPMRVATPMGWQHQCNQCQHNKENAM